MLIWHPFVKVREEIEVLDLRLVLASPLNVYLMNEIQNWDHIAEMKKRTVINAHHGNMVQTSENDGEHPSIKEWHIV
jgi:hypothetical protein